MYPQRSVMTCGLATALEPPHFNHAPVRGATPAPDLRIRGRVVSIHAPAWGATDQNASAWAAKFVSIHAPAWGATQGGPEQSGCGCSFNPRTRVGCDRPPCPWKIRPPQFQSTHPRGVRPSAGQVTLDCLPVSIHAPAWGATPPAPATPSPTRWFQSTHPRGVRRRIVAPAPSPHRFNPRTRVGCDPKVTGKGQIYFVFQSTHPRGVRRRRRCVQRGDTWFQSTHPRGVRHPARCEIHIWSAVSIHAPAWGATAGLIQPRRSPEVSIHAPAWGATGLLFGWGTWLAVFQSTHPRGVRHHLCAAGQGTGPVSIHAPAWGATRACPSLAAVYCSVSIHAPAWGATVIQGLYPLVPLVSIHAPAWGAT